MQCCVSAWRDGMTLNGPVVNFHQGDNFPSVLAHYLKYTEAYYRNFVKYTESASSSDDYKKFTSFDFVSTQHLLLNLTFIPDSSLEREMKNVSLLLYSPSQ